MAAQSIAYHAHGTADGDKYCCYPWLVCHDIKSVMHSLLAQARPRMINHLTRYCGNNLIKVGTVLCLFPQSSDRPQESQPGSNLAKWWTCREQEAKNCWPKKRGAASPILPPYHTSVSSFVSIPRYMCSKWLIMPPPPPPFLRTHAHTHTHHSGLDWQVYWSVANSATWLCPWEGLQPAHVCWGHPLLCVLSLWLPQPLPHLWPCQVAAASAANVPY